MADGLVAALARCQAKFPAIVKSHTNPAFKGSQYADVADVLAAVRPVLAAEGIAVSQYTEIDAETGGVALITTLMYSLDEGMSSRFPLHVSGLTDQQVGSKLTYHRRYQLCALLGVHPVGDDDDGNLAATAQTAPQPRSEPAVVAPDMSKPLASMSIAELRGAAKEMGHDFGNGAITKAEMIRQLEPLVRALSGAEPFDIENATQREGGRVLTSEELGDAGVSPATEPTAMVSELPSSEPAPRNTTANPAGTARDELRNMRPDVRKSVIRGGE